MYWFFSKQWDFKTTCLFTSTWKALDLVTSSQIRAFFPHGYCSFLFTLAIIIFLISTTVGNVCSEIPFRTLSEHLNAPQQTILSSACVTVAFERWSDVLRLLCNYVRASAVGDNNGCDQARDPAYPINAQRAKASRHQRMSPLSLYSMQTFLRVDLWLSTPSPSGSREMCRVRPVSGSAYLNTKEDFGRTSYACFIFPFGPVVQHRVSCFPRFSTG